MSLDRQFEIGETVVLGSHTFGAEEIKAFASKFDPQPFHLDEEAARHSVFGALCASGWHTISTWMKHNAASFPATVERSARWGAPITFGPAASLRDLKWLKPVYVGDTITFTRTGESHRALQSRPGWHMLTTLNEGTNQSGSLVMSFYAMVLLKAG